MLSILATFLITLGLGQFSATWLQLHGASLVGPARLAGYGLGLVLISTGLVILPAHWGVMWWVPPAGLLAMTMLLWGGSVIAPPPHPNRLFAANHPAHATCKPVKIPERTGPVPGLLLYPPPKDDGEVSNESGNLATPAVCIIPGAGDTKVSFKWRLIEALLAEGLIVLTVDPPGHGEYRHRPMSYPDCLTIIPAALTFLKTQPGVGRVGLVGISLGGALSLRSLAEVSNKDSMGQELAEALVIIATPTHLNYRKTLFYQELWGTICRAPSLPLLRELSLKQAWQIWHTGGYHSRHSTAELIEHLQPLTSIQTLKQIPTLLIYSARDRVAPPAMARAMRQAAPWAAFLGTKKASHVMLTLIPAINAHLAGWLREQLSVVP